MKSICILMIEDCNFDAVIVKRFLRLIQDFSFEITHVHCMQDGIKFLLQKAPDLILLDLHLPDCEGIETIHKITNIVKNRPIITITGHEDKQIIAKSQELGISSYLLKENLNREILLQAITKAIGK